MAQELGLGILFQGRVDAAFRNAVNQLNTILDQLNSRLVKMAGGANNLQKAMAQGGSELSSYQKMMGNASAETAKLQQALAHFGSQTGKTDAELKRMRSSVYKVNNSIAAQAEKMNNAGRSGTKFYETANRINLTNQQLAGTLKATSTGFQKVATVSADARNLVQGVQKSMTRVSGASKAATASMQPFHKGLLHIRDAAKGAETYMGRFNYALSSMVAWIPAAIAVSALVQGIYSGIAAIRDFNQALKNLQAIANLTEVETEQLGQKILEVAANTKYSATEVADALVLIEQAGFSASEAIETIDAVANLAVGTLSDMKTTSDLVTTALRVFNLDAVESGRVADVFANAVNRSKLTIDKLRVSLNYLGPIASSAGLSIEETAAATMIMANAGIRASTIGTGLRQVFARILSPTSKFRAAIKDAGLSLKDFNIESQGISTVMGNLAKVIKDPGDALSIFGLRAGNAAVLLSKLGKEGFEYMVIQASEAGSALRMAETQMEGLGVAAKNLADRIQNIAVTMGEGGLGRAALLVINVLRELTGVIGNITNTLGGVFLSSWLGVTGAIWLAIKALRGLMVLGLSAWFGTTISYTRQLIATFGLMNVATGKVVSSIGLLATSFRWLKILIAALIVESRGYVGAITSAQAATQLLNATLLLNPLTWIIGVVAAVAAAYWTYQKAVLRSRVAAQSLLDEHNRSVAVLEKYQKRIEETKDKQELYNVQVDRLIQDFPELKKEIDKTGRSYDALNNVVAKGIALEKEQANQAYYENREKLLAAYEKEEQALEVLQLRYRMATDSASELEKQQFHTLSFWTKAAHLIRATASSLGLATSNEEKMVELMGKSQAKLDLYTKSIVKNTRAREKMFGIDIAPEEVFPEKILEKGKKIMEQLDRFEQAMEAMKKTTEGFEDQYVVFMEHLGDVTEEELESVEANWINYYHELDGLQRMHLTSAIAAAAKEVEEMEKKAREMKTDEEIIAKERLKILKNHFDEAIDAADAYYTELMDLVVESYENQNESIKERYRQRERDAELAMEAELALLNKLEMGEEEVAIKRQEIRDKYYADEKFGLLMHYEEVKSLTDNALDVLKESFESSYESRNKDVGKLNEKYLELEKELYDDLEKAGEDYYDSMLSRYKSLSKERDSLLNKVRDAAKNQIDMERSVSSEIAELQREGEDSHMASLLAQEEMRANFYDAMIAMQEASSAEELEIAKSYAGDAKSLIDDLVGHSVERDNYGRIQFIENAEATKRAKIQALEEYRSVMNQIFEKEKLFHKEQADSIGKEMDTLILSMQTLQTELDKIREKRIEIDTQLAQTALDDLKAKAENLDVKVVVQFMGEGSEVKMISEKVEDVTTLMDDFRNKLKEMEEAEDGKGVTFTISFYGRLSGDEYLPISEAVAGSAGVSEKINALAIEISEMKPEFVVDYQKTMEGLTSVKELLEYLSKTWSATLLIKIIGKATLESVKKTWDSLKDKTITLTIKKRETNQTGGEVGYSQKYSTGGSVPGYGGGDTVPSLLERGEYVQPKEIVKKYGLGFMEWLRRGMMPKSWAEKLMKGQFATLRNGGLPLAESLTKSVRAINQLASPQGGARQVHVLDLRVGDVSMPVRTVESSEYLSSGIREFERMLNKRRLRRG